MFFNAVGVENTKRATSKLYFILWTYNFSTLPLNKILFFDFKLFGLHCKCTL